MVVRSLILLALVAFPLTLAAVPGQSAHMKARSPRSLEDISTCTNACLARNNQCVAECSPFDVDCVMNCVKTHAGRCTCGCKKELPSDALIPSRAGIETLKLSNLTIPLLGATRETYPGEVLAIVGCVSDAVQDVNDCTFRCPANPPFDCETSCYTQFFYRVCSCSNIGGSGASSAPIVASSLLAAALVVATSCS